MKHSPIISTQPLHARATISSLERWDTLADSTRRRAAVSVASTLLWFSDTVRMDAQVTSQCCLKSPNMQPGTHSPGLPRPILQLTGAVLCRLGFLDPALLVTSCAGAPFRQQQPQTTGLNHLQCRVIAMGVRRWVDGRGQQQVFDYSTTRISPQALLLTATGRFSYPLIFASSACTSLSLIAH